MFKILTIIFSIIDYWEESFIKVILNKIDMLKLNNIL